MALPLESVPNFSAAADQVAVDAIRAALVATTALLDVHTDVDHNRSVFTVAATPDSLVDGLSNAARAAVEAIDLREHDGVHPCVGAVDVIPIVPLGNQSHEGASRAAHELAARLADELELPIFLYGESCPDRRLPEGKRPAFYRRGGPERLAERMAAGELRPDFGPGELHPSAGATLVGVRAPLIAFNVNLATCDVEVAREIAALIREIDGGFAGVRALGLELETRGVAQVSMNIEDWQATPPHQVVAAVEAAAAERGVQVAGSELVGLLPAGATLAAAGAALGLPKLSTDDVLELRLLEETMGRQAVEG